MWIFSFLQFDVFFSFPFLLLEKIVFIHGIMAYLGHYILALPFLAEAVSDASAFFL